MPQHLPLLSARSLWVECCYLWRGARWMKFSRRSLSSAIIFPLLEMGAGREGGSNETKKEKKKKQRRAEECAFLMMNPLRPLI